MIKGLIFSLAVGGIVVGGAGQALANAESVGLYTVTNITSNDGVHDLFPVVNSESTVVWQREMPCADSNLCAYNYEIFMYSPETGVVQITDNSVDDYYPEANQQGVIVWMAQDGNDWEIWQYNIHTGLLAQMTDNDVDDKYPQISAGGNIVWNTFDGSDWEISYYVPSGDAVFPLSGTLLTNNDHDDFLSSGYMDYFNNEFDYSRPYKDNAPLMSSDGKIAWMANDGNDWEVWSYTPETDVITQVTDNEVDDRYPQINEAGTMAWEKFDGNDFGIAYLGDDEQIVYISVDEGGQNIWDDLHPKLNSRGDVSWISYDGNDWEIALYTAATRKTEILTDNDYDEIYHTINNNSDIAWLTWAPNVYGGNPFILSHYRSRIGEYCEVTNFMSFFPYPRLNDNNEITWFWSEWQGYDIALAKPNPVIVRFAPGKLKLKTRRRWLQAIMEMPETVNVDEIDTASLVLKMIDGVDLERTLPADRVVKDDFNGDGIEDLKVKFPMAGLRGLLKKGRLELAVTGTFLDGTPFGGSGSLRIVDRKRKDRERHNEHGKEGKKRKSKGRHND